MRRPIHRFFLAILLLTGATAMNTFADEGMWLVNDPPREKLRDKYQFDLTDAWLNRAMHASVRFNNGGSGGFVSPTGLIVTNHHIGADALQKHTTSERDLLKDGFLAQTRPDELRCHDLELNVLQSIDDVTAQIETAVTKDMTPADAARARRAVMSKIEKESLDKTGLRSDVVTLYQGGMYHLYRYKKYTDVRLVFAPEASVAGFGGDVDNFEYPRFGFDVCFFRAYENDEPAKVEHYFSWSKVGPKEGDLVFVTGHPGTTNRLETVGKFKHRRDQGHPYALARLRTMEAALSQFSERGPDEHRIAATDLHRVANARKAMAGQYEGLLDGDILIQKNAEELALVQHNKLDQSPWNGVHQAITTFMEFEREYYLFERGDGFSSELFTIARHLVRLAKELQKPSGERLREYRDTNLDSLKMQLFSPAPIYPELERVKLTAALTFFAEQFGGEHRFTEEFLKDKRPSVRAAELIAGCRLMVVAERRKLFDGGWAAIEKSPDTMIRLAWQVDEYARPIRKKFEDEVEEPERQGYSKIAKVRFSKFGRTVAPDATFTLRLAFGTVQGYEADGQKFPFFTTLGGLFERGQKRQFREPFAIPVRWRNAERKLDLTTPLDFVSTADTIGGNSGSPVLNRKGELIGINFDRNRPGLVRNFVYTDVQARHIAVHGAAVVEALRKVYDASELANELMPAR